jgi:hypothetical protein
MLPVARAFARGAGRTPKSGPGTCTPAARRAVLPRIGGAEAPTDPHGALGSDDHRSRSERRTAAPAGRAANGHGRTTRWARCAKQSSANATPRCCCRPDPSVCRPVAARLLLRSGRRERDYREGDERGASVVTGGRALGDEGDRRRGGGPVREPCRGPRPAGLQGRRPRRFARRPWASNAAPLGYSPSEDGPSGPVSRRGTG